ncbi:MAG: TonB-dependent receptor, partial [Candidatus Zixiibacteriota bacterium]
MRYITCILGLLALTAAAAAETYHGLVTDKTGEPLPGVSVISDVTGIGTQTDANGYFTLSGDGITRLTFSSVGYRPRQFSAAALPDTIRLEVMYYKTGEIVVTGDRAQSGVDAIAFDNVSRDEIARDYSVGEFPLLLSSTPNFFAYTDGGAPLGYSYLRIRGFNDQRIATYINGVPLNDPEDQFTYFVDLPDFASNISDIQVQRGVGNSLYGDASFGGSINVVSNVFDKPKGTRLVSGFGGFTHDGSFYGRQISKQSLEYSSGLVDGRWAFYGRFSRQGTSGYRESSWYHGWSYYLSVGRLDPRMTTELHVYGGPMRMHLAFYGVDRATLDQNRLYNPLTYANETDNFNQPHFQLHNRYLINDHTTLSNTVFYIRGQGFFEQLKRNRDYREYNLAAFTDSTSGDLVRRKWVEKQQLGWNGRLDITHDRGRHSLGGSFYYFDSDHWGQVISAEHLTRSVNPSHRYYEYFGKKYVGSFYAQERLGLTDRVTVQATAQLRYARFDFNQVKMGAFKGYNFGVDWLFFSPRLGINYTVAPGTNLYTNFAVSSRAPNDDNIYDSDNPDAYPLLQVKSNVGDTLFTFGDPLNGSERAYDIEAGISHRGRRYEVNLNLFVLRYDNEYIFDFGADGVDSNTTLTIPRSYHTGIELSGSVKPHDLVNLSGSFSYNYNRIDNYPANLDGTTV